MSWNGQKSDLVPGEVYSATVRLQADAACVENVYMSLMLDYYFTGTGASTRVAVYDRFLHLPVALRATP